MIAAMDAASVALLNPRSGGHHTAYLTGLVSAAGRAGLGGSVWAPDSLADTLGGGPLEFRPFTNSGRLSMRRQWRSVLGRVFDEQATPVDLYLDSHVWSLPTNLDRHGPHTHVIHKIRIFGTDGRTRRGKVMAQYLRRRLRHVLGEHGRIVTHTDATRRSLATWLPADRIDLAGYPVTVPHETSPIWCGDEPEILFVGANRRDKGLPILLDAIPQLQSVATIRIVGCNDLEITARAQHLGRPCDVVGPVGAAELDEAYRRAAIVVVPYTSHFASGLGTSGVLLDALSHGRPTVVTTAVEDVLPPDFEGSVVVDADSPTALASGLDRAIAELDDLSAAALAGPEFVAEHHSFDDYLRVVAPAAFAEP